MTPDQSNGRFPALPLAAILLLAFALRLGLNIALQGLDAPPDPNLGSDHVEYNLIAKNLARGHGYTLYRPEGPTAWRPPGTPLFIAGVYKLFGIHHAAARIAFSLAGALTCLPLFFIARRFLPRNWSLLCALALALYPAHAYYSMHFYSEPPWTLLVTTAVALGMRLNESGNAAWGIPQGILLGLAALIRPIAFTFPLIQAVLLIWAARCAGKSWRAGFRKLPLSLAPVLFCVLTVMPWPIRNQRVLGHTVLFSTHGGVTLYGSTNETVFSDPELIGRWISPKEAEDAAMIYAEGHDEFERDRIMIRLTREFVTRHAVDMPRLVAWKILRLVQPWPGTPNRMFNWAVCLGYVLLIPFILLGFVARINDARFVPAYTAVLMILANAVLLYGDHRFRISIAPVLLLFAAAGLYGLVCFIRGPFPKGEEKPEPDAESGDPDSKVQ